MKNRAKETGSWGGAHLVLNREDAWRSKVDGVGPVMAHGEARGRGGCRASPGLLSRRGSPGGVCGGVQRVSAAYGSPAARNRAGGRTHLWRRGALLRAERRGGG